MCEPVGPGPGRTEALVCEPVGPGPERREALVCEPVGLVGLTLDTRLSISEHCDSERVSCAWVRPAGQLPRWLLLNKATADKAIGAP